MNKRTLYLLAGAACIALLYGGDQAYRHWYEEPIRLLESRIDGLQKREGDRRKAQAVAVAAEEQREGFVRYSLPYDPEQARSAYRAWLLEWVGRHGMTSASVDAGPPRPIEVDARTRKGKRQVATRLGFSLRARTDLPHLTDALDEFYAAGHLHKITDMAITPIGSASDLELVMSIEALSMESCVREGELSTASWERTSGDRSASLASVPRRNIFARGGSRALLRTRLSAITFDRDGLGEAWFETADGGTTIVPSGGTLPVGLTQVQVVDVQAERVYLLLDGEPMWVALDQHLADEPPSSPVAE